MKNVKYLLIIIGTLVFSSFARPPYMWYATYHINNYHETCDPAFAPDLTMLGAAQNFSAGMQYYSSLGYINNSSYQINRADADCNASQWIGPNDGDGAEINFVDIAFYGGHGWAWGPYLNCTLNGQPKSNGMKLHGAYGYLKWLFMYACDVLSDIPLGDDVFQRWNVRQSDGQSAFQGLHCIMGNRSTSWNTGYGIGGVFLQQWMQVQKSISDAYFWASYFNFYASTLINGSTVPAVLSADLGTGYRPGYSEFYEEATDDPAPTGATGIIWTTYSRPW